MSAIEGIEKPLLALPLAQRVVLAESLLDSLPPTGEVRSEAEELAEVERREREIESEFVRRAVQKQLWADAFEETRRRLVPQARAKRIYTDEDVFNVVS